MEKKITDRFKHTQLAKAQCPYCGVGCGLEIVEDSKGRIKIKGDSSHISTMGDLCLKPIPLPKVMNIGRIPSPMYRENKRDKFKPISWEEAYKIIAEKLKENKPDENYFYISGQLTTEDSYIINKFVKGFVKTNNIDANSRLCMASAVMGYKLSFGSDGPPGSYEDIDDADTFIFAGSNAAWTHPVLFKRVLKRKKEYPEAKIITIDPVYTETAKKSDIWIPIKPGTDVVLFNSVLYLLNKYNWIDSKFIIYHTENFDKAVEEAKKYPPEVAARICGIDEKYIYKLAEFFGHSKKLISFWTMGLNQSVNGTMKNLALINLHLATGRINEKGCPFSLTGQPNAMGGREVGYLVNGLPGYRDVRNPEDRKYIENFWGIPEGSIKDKPGKTIVEAVDEMIKGNIKLLWIVCTNPVVTMPNLNKFWKALRNTFVIVQDAYVSDSVDYANLILPATQWGEKEGVMTNSERVITYNKKFKEPPENARDDWKIFCDVAKELGWGDYFNYKNSEEIFNEYKQTTKGRLCDISDFTYKDLPKQWGGKWLYKDKKFPTPSGKAKFNPAIFEEPSDKDEYPFSFRLITGRTKKQWHTMTRTGKSLELIKGEEEPFILLNDEDAYELGIVDGDYINVQSKRGKIYIRVKTGKIRKGVAFAPFGYGTIYHFPTNIVVSDAIDPISKEPDLKASAVYIKEKRKRVPFISEEAISIVQSSYIKVMPKMEQVFKKLYQYIFEARPELKEKFERDLDNIARAQASFIALFIKNLENIEKIKDEIDRISKIHAEKRIQPKDYELFKEMFVKSLGETIKLTYNEREAWKEAYDYISALLIEREKRILEKELLNR